MRYLLSTLMMILLAIGFAACNPVDEDNGDSSENADGRKPSHGEEDPQSSEPIKFGFNLELTGDAATFGISTRDGALLAIDEINEAGGILGRRIEPVIEDNATKSDQAVSVASKLINQDKVDVLIGCVASSMSIAMARKAEEFKVPMVTPNSTKPSVTVDQGKTRRYIFRTCFTDDFQAERMARYAVDGIGAKKAVIFYDAAQDYSVGIYETIKKVAPELGLELVAEDSFLSDQESDFRTKLNKFKTLDFEVLIVPGYYNKVAMIANQARELGIEQPLLGGDGFDSPDLWKNAGKNIEGSYFTNHYSKDDMDPAIQDFVSKYKSRYASVPDAMAILGYDAVNVVADAIKRAGSTDKEAITDALAATKNFKAATGSITMDEHHNAVKKLVVIEIGEGGEFKWKHTYEPEGAEDKPAVDDGQPMIEDGEAGPEAVGEAPGDAGEEAAEEEAGEAEKSTADM